MNIKFRYVILLFILLCSFSLYAQNENNVWCFGHNVGLDFNTTPPTLFQTNMNVMEGCTSVSDEAGSLLFYTNGHMVWDKYGNQMPNATGLLGNAPDTGNYIGSSKHGVAVVRNPQAPNQYYLFCASSMEEYPNYHIYYSIIDMTLNSGLGDINFVKNYILTSGTDEPISIVRHSECNSFWLLTMTTGTFKTFKAFSITSAGINTTPVTASLPYGIANNPIKGAKNDSLLLFTGNDIYTYEFNKTTGQISNPQTIVTANPSPGYLEFSADETKMYGCGLSSGNVIQWDFSLWPNTTAVSASAVSVFGGSSIFGGIRRGPDGKIYLRPVLADVLSVINNPTGTGAACNFTGNGIALPAYALNPLYNVANFLELGITYVPPSPPDTVFHITDSTHCFAENIELKVDTGYVNYTWSTGDTTTDISVNLPGTYWVSRYKDCKIFLDSFYIHSQQIAVLNTYKHDTSMCGTGTLTLQVPDTFDTYTWNTGQTTADINVQQSGTYWRLGYKGCGITVDSFSVVFNEADTLTKSIDTTVCFGQSLTLQTPGSYYEYIWSDGSNAPSLTVSHDGTYFRRAYKDCDARYDSFKVHFVNFDVALDNDTLLCPGETLTIGTTVPGATYRWQDGSSNSQYTVDREGLYTLTVSVAPCSLTDSIQVTYLDAASLILEQGDTSICNEKPLRLTAEVSGQGSLLWSTGAVTPDIDIAKAGTYIITYTDPCVVLSDSVAITEFNCNCVPFIPNAFSPNGDGNNDVFFLRLTCPVRRFDLKIFNRFGEMVFHGTKVEDEWDGMYKNAPCDISTYFYYLVYTGFNDKVYTKKGDLTLLH